MSTGVISWSQTAATNATADANVNWAEGMAPSQVNDSARALMTSVAKYRDDMSGGQAFTGGGPTTYTLTTNQGFTSLSQMNGQSFDVYWGVTNAAGATLNVDGLGAKAIQLDDGTAVPAGFLRFNVAYSLVYFNSSGIFLIKYNGAASYFLPPGIINPYAGSSAPAGWLLCDGTGYSQSTFAGLFGAISTTYGSTGAGMFSVPDLRARVPAGLDPGNGTGRQTGALSGGVSGGAASLGNSGGVEGLSLTTAQLPTFTPSGTIGGSQTFNNVVTSAGGQNVGSAAAPALNTPGSITVNGSNFTFTGNSIGSGGQHNNMQPTLILNYIIKT